MGFSATAAYSASRERGFSGYGQARLATSGFSGVVRNLRNFSGYSVLAQVDSGFSGTSGFSGFSTVAHGVFTNWNEWVLRLSVAFQRF
jgi:hypothetical protein